MSKITKSVIFYHVFLCNQVKMRVLFLLNGHQYGKNLIFFYIFSQLALELSKKDMAYLKHKTGTTW